MRNNQRRHLPAGQRGRSGACPLDAEALRQLTALRVQPLLALEDRHDLLDGHLRYQVLLELGAPSVPCLVHPRNPGERQ